MKRATKVWIVVIAAIIVFAVLAKWIGWISITLICVAAAFAAGYVMGRNHAKRD